MKTTFLGIAPILVTLAACGARPEPAPKTTAAPATPAAANLSVNAAKPCAASARLVKSLRGPMHIDAYVTTGMPMLDAYVRDLRELLDAYARESAGRLAFTVIEPRDADAKQRAKDAGLAEVTFGAATEDGAGATTVRRGFLGLVISYGSETDTIKQLTPDAPEGLELWITTKLRDVRDRADSVFHDIGVLTGHGELPLTDENLLPTSAGQSASIGGIIAKYFPFYRLREVSAKKELPDTLEGLLVTQPERDLDDAELRRIDDFVMKGKRLVIVASAVNVKAGDAQMKATLSAHGLEKLASGYGIELRRDVVLDFGRGFRVNVFAQEGPRLMSFPMFVDVLDTDESSGSSLDTRFQALYHIPALSFSFASSLALHREKQPRASVRALAQTTPKATLATGDTVDLSPFQAWKPRGALAQHVVAAVAEGTLTSAFGARTSAKPGGVLVLSSSQLFANPFARAAATSSAVELEQFAMPYAQQVVVNAILVAKGTLDWMSADPDFAACALPRRQGL